MKPLRHQHQEAFILKVPTGSRESVAPSAAGGATTPSPSPCPGPGPQLRILGCLCRHAPAVVRVRGRRRSFGARPPREEGVCAGGAAVRGPAAVGGEVGAVRPRYREEPAGRDLLRRPEPEDPSPAESQEAHPVSEVRRFHLIWRRTLQNRRGRRTHKNRRGRRTLQNRRVRAPGAGDALGWFLAGVVETLDPDSLQD